MLDDVRRRVQDRLESMTPQAAEDVAASLRSRLQEVGEQFSGLASGFLQWSAEARKSLMDEVRSIVAGQVQEMGLATKQEVEALRARLDRLEGGLSGPSGRPPSRTGVKRGSKTTRAGSTRATAAGRSTRTASAGRTTRTASAGRSARGSGSSGSTRSTAAGKRKSTRTRRGPSASSRSGTVSMEGPGGSGRA
jgi:hypothetical protein